MRRRLVLVAAATTSMVALAFVIPLAALVRSFAHEQAMADAQAQARALAPVIAASEARNDLEAAVRAVSDASGTALTVFLDDGAVLGAPAAADDDVAAARTGRAFTAPADDGQAVLVPVVRRGGGVAVVRVLVPDAELNAGVAAAWAMLSGLGLALVAGAVAVADRLARSTVASVRELEHVADRIGQGDLGARAIVADPPEVAAVADALHTLAERVRGLLAAERETVADLSHRVRTPLMALRLDIETLGDSPQAQRLAADAEQLETAVTDAIEQARRTAGARAARETDLPAAIAARVAFWNVLADDQGRALSVDLQVSSLKVPLPRDEVEAVIDVLVGNVFAHTPQRGEVRVTVSADGASCWLTVDDDGPGFGDDLALGRGVSGAGSTGLGLDIARRAAERTGGELLLGRNPSGGGRVELRFGTTATPTRAGSA